MGQGFLTGLALCTGHSYTKATPVFESAALNENIRYNFIAGRVVNKYYQQLLLEGGKIKAQGGDQWPLTVEDMKEKMSEMQPMGTKATEKTYKMPDG